MIFKWLFVIIVHLFTNFSLSLRVTATFQSSQANSKIDTSSQDTLPRTAPELKCSFASSTKPILQPPQVVKLSKDNKVSNIKNNGQNDDEEAKCKLNINSDYERTNAHGKSSSDLNKKKHAINENKK